MIQYKTIYLSSRYVDKIVNELSTLGWTLHTRKDVRYREDLDILGPFNNDEDRPLVELTIMFDDSLPGHSKELSELSKDYFQYRDAFMKTVGKRIGGFITGIVFGSIITLVGFIILLSGLITSNSSTIVIVGSIILALGFPAMPLGIWGIKHRSKSRKIANAEYKEKLDQMFFEAQKLTK